MSDAPMDRSELAARLLLSVHVRVGRDVTDLIGKFADSFGDYVIVDTSESTGKGKATGKKTARELEDITNRIEAVGKKVLPILTFGSNPVYGHPNAFVDLTSPAAYGNQFSSVTDFVKDSLGRFDRVGIGNAGPELGTRTSRADWGELMWHGKIAPSQLIDQAKAAVDALPWLESKLFMIPFGPFIDREAFFLDAEDPDFEPSIRPFCESTGAWLFMATGACSLYETLEEYEEKYFAQYRAANYVAYAFGGVIPRRDRVGFPLTHLRRYISTFPTRTWSGLGWAGGGKDCNMSALVSAGWYGAWGAFPTENPEAIFTETAPGPTNHVSQPTEQLDDKANAAKRVGRSPKTGRGFAAG